MGAVIGTQLQDVSTKCNNEWNRYNDTIGNCKPDWDIILDDSRHINANTTATEFSAHTSNMIENVFLGCKEMLSREVHDQFVEIITKRVAEITQYDWEHCDKDPFNQVIKLFRSTEDLLMDRKTEMLFVMVIRITRTASAKWESCLKLQLRSHKIIPPAVTEPARPRCSQNQQQYLFSALQRAPEQLLLDPT